MQPHLLLPQQLRRRPMPLQALQQPLPSQLVLINYMWFTYK